MTNTDKVVSQQLPALRAQLDEPIVGSVMAWKAQSKIDLPLMSAVGDFHSFVFGEEWLQHGFQRGFA